MHAGDHNGASCNVVTASFESKPDSTVYDKGCAREKEIAQRECKCVHLCVCELSNMCAYIELCVCECMCVCACVNGAKESLGSCIGTEVFLRACVCEREREQMNAFKSLRQSSIKLLSELLIKQKLMQSFSFKIYFNT